MTQRKKMTKNAYRLTLGNLIIWSILIILLYSISLINFHLFHILVELFSILIAYIVFLIIWRSKGFISNRYLIFLGIAYFFVGSYDLLHALSFEGTGIFPGLNNNPSTQFWIIARYLESISYLIAPLFLIKNTNYEMNDFITSQNSQFARKVFLIYALITAYLLISVLYLKNFPTCYIVGSGVTLFKIISEYIICFILLCSFFTLYKTKDRFETKVFNLLVLSIGFTVLGDVPFLIYNHLDPFPSTVAHFFKAVSFYYLYLAIVETGFNKLALASTEFREKLHFEQETIFLENEQNLIYSLLGVERKTLQQKKVVGNSEEIDENYNLAIRNFNGIMFQLNKNLLPIFMEGSIEEITGYSKKDFISGKVKWADIIIPEYLSIAPNKAESIDSKLNSSVGKEYRICRKDGEIRWVMETLKQVNQNNVKYQGAIHDITIRKEIEENLKNQELKKQEEARIKEIHHRIKNNLQVISSLLDLEADKFSNKEDIKDSEVLEAFRESQDRVISMALIHEELYKGKRHDTLDFSLYIEKLTESLFNTYKVGNIKISLNMDLEENLFFDMDTAVPLGIIVNELVSNSLKHAFPGRDRGEILIKLCREKTEKCINSTEERKSKDCKSTSFILTVSDNGVGIPENLEIEDLDSLGIQLVTSLVDQLDGELELKRNNGTEFIMRFTETEK